MESFEKIFRGFYTLFLFAKLSMLDVCGSPAYAAVAGLKILDDSQENEEVLIW